MDVECVPNADAVGRCPPDGSRYGVGLQDSQRVYIRLELRQPCKLHVEVVAIRAHALMELVDKRPESSISSALACECVRRRQNAGSLRHREIQPFLVRAANHHARPIGTRQVEG